MYIYILNKPVLKLYSFEINSSNLQFLGQNIYIIIIIIIIIIVYSIGLSPDGSGPTLVQTKIKIHKQQNYYNNKTTTKHQYNTTKQLQNSKDNYTNRTQKM